MTVCFLNTSQAQSKKKYVYNQMGEKKTFVAEKENIIFKSRKTEGARLTKLVDLNTVIDFSFNVSEYFLKKRIAKLMGEYKKQHYYQQSSAGDLPFITFQREVKMHKESVFIPAFVLNMIPKKFKDYDLYYLEITDLDLAFSKAKFRPKTNLNYIIECKLQLLVNNRIKTVTLDPIVLSQIMPKANQFKANQYRSSFFEFGPNDGFLGLTISISESSPSVVKLEKILDAITKHKAKAKEVIVKLVED